MPSADTPRAERRKPAPATPLPGLGGPETLPTGSELENLRRANEQMNARCNQIEARFQKAVRIIDKLKNKIGDIEAQLIEAQMDADEAREQLQAVLSHRTTEPAPAADEGKKAA